MSAPAVPAWSVHLPTVDATVVRLALRPRGDRDPWPFTQALTEIARLGATGRERFRSLGAGRGQPLLASQELEWRGCELHVETAGAEATLELPPWDELTQSQATEEDLWDLVDTLAAATGASHGAIGDGEALRLEPPTTQRALASAVARHPALLLPPGTAAAVAGLPLATVALYRELPRSGLEVLLR